MQTDVAVWHLVSPHLMPRGQETANDRERKSTTVCVCVCVIEIEREREAENPVCITVSSASVPHALPQFNQCHYNQ